MMDKITDTIIFYMTNHHADINDLDLFQFGLKKFLNYLTMVISIIMCSVLLQNVELSIIFALSFFYMREYCGGLHLKTKLGCFCFSLIFLLFFPYLIKIFSINIIALNTIYILSILGSLQVAPVDHRNKKIRVEQKIYFRKKLLKRITVLVLVTISAFVFVDNPKIANTLEVSVIMNFISMVTASIMNYLDVKNIKGREELS